MAVVTDFTKTPAAILLDLINQSNGTSIPAPALTFGLPTAATGGSPTRDTDITVTAVNGSGYKGNRALHYNRVDLAVVPGSRGATIVKGDATKVSDLLADINALWGVNIGASDIVDADLPAFAGTANETHDVQLVASADALVFRGSVTITVKGDDLDLATVLTVTDLDGLNWVAQ